MCAAALEPLLRDRERIEDERRRAMLQRQRELEAARARLLQLDEAYRARLDAQTQLDAGALQLQRARLERFERQLSAQRSEVAERSSAFERARDELLAAATQRKAVERLRERRIAASLAEAVRREREDFDEGNARRQEDARPRQ